MELPNRIQQHKIDSAGIGLLNYLLPDDYIFRALGERDYGIDGLMELAIGDHVTGKFISIQLKSSRKFRWNQNNTVSITIPKSTCNYWMNNSMPVFMFIADLSLNSLFYIDVKKQLRQRYSELLNQENFIFYIPFTNKLEKYYNIDNQKYQNDKLYFSKINTPKILLFRNILHAIHVDDFTPVLLQFILNWRSYFEHISHQHADPFLVQPLIFLQKTEYICSVINKYNFLYNANLNQINLQEIKAQCKDAYTFWATDSNDEVLEFEITKIHSQISALMDPFVSSIKHLFLELEKTYWLQTNPVIVEISQKINWSEYKPF